MEPVASSDALEQFELAFARLEWAQAAGCGDLTSQLEALKWHVGCCEAARHAINRTPTEPAPCFAARTSRQRAQPTGQHAQQGES
jgi:hypothetical protein